MAELKYAYIFRQDFDNPGDLYSSIMHYLYPDKSGLIIDVFNNNIPEFEVDVVFIGGGAILTTKKFINGIDNILSKIKTKYKIVWGAGYNFEINKDIDSRFDMIGVRDFGTSNYDWVPCPSVLHPAFNENLKKISTKDFLIIDHWKRPITFNKKVTRIANKPNNINAILEAIAEHRYVITTSYHAAYWATLLRKKTIVVGSNLPQKFYTLKHQPLIVPKVEVQSIDEATVYHSAYDECVLANNVFRAKVENFIGIDFTFINRQQDIILI